MTGATVRLPDPTRVILKELADQTGEPIQVIVARAVEAFRRQRILELTNAAYAALHADESAWQEEMAEREDWDGTLADGLEDE